MSAFTYNVAYTIAANRGAAPAERLTRAELWQGVKRGARHPGEFAAHVQACTVLPGGTRNEFVREIVIGDGGVHAKSGRRMTQDVFLQDNLYVRTLNFTIHILTDRIVCSCWQRCETPALKLP